MAHDNTLRSATIRLAQDNPDLRPHLLPLLRVAEVFPSQKALDTYLREHPKAKPSNHSVETHKSETPKGDAGLAKRQPKIESPDLKRYPAHIDVEKLKPEHREEIKGYDLAIVGRDARQAVEIARKIKDGIDKSADVCKMNPAVCAKNLGLTRDKMPQIEGEKTVKQMLNSSNELDRKKGKAMVEAGADPDSDKTVLDHLLDHLKKNGVKSSDQKVAVGSLHATQSEIKAAKVYGMADSFLKGKFDKIDDAVVVSKDGHILDGHHRWAALLTIDPHRPMKVRVIDMTMKDLLKEAQAVPGVYKADFEGNPLDTDAQKKYKEEASSTFKKQAMVFPSEAAWERYKREHPGAKRSDHTVKKQSPEEKRYWQRMREDQKDPWRHKDVEKRTPPPEGEVPDKDEDLDFSLGVRKAVIRLAFANPELRPHLLPLLAS